MAWGARPGLKPHHLSTFNRVETWLNGLGSPSGIETKTTNLNEARRSRLNGLGSPSGIETELVLVDDIGDIRLNGLGSPSGIETPLDPGVRPVIEPG